jgi:polyhydroxybutyrate depolymerase
MPTIKATRKGKPIATWENLGKRLKVWDRKQIPGRSVFGETQGTHFFSIQLGPHTRQYYVHLPPSYDGNSPTPLILNFHGGGGSAEGHMRMTKMNTKADTGGFIVVWPRGTGKDTHTVFRRFWNFENGKRGPIHDDPFFAGVDDVDFIHVLLDDIESKFYVDKNRIFATGFSNGGILCHYLACKLSSRIAAIAPVAAPFWMDPASCVPSRPVSMIYFHGTADVCAPYYGGPSECEAGLTKRGRIFISVKETVAFWIHANQCPPEPKVTFQNGEVTCKTYGPGLGNSEVTVCTIQGGGHTWPGGLPYKIPGFQIGKVTYDINANDAMWEFFLRHPMSAAQY